MDGDDLVPFVGDEAVVRDVRSESQGIGHSQRVVVSRRGLARKPEIVPVGFGKKIRGRTSRISRDQRSRVGREERHVGDHRDLRIFREIQARGRKIGKIVPIEVHLYGRRSFFRAGHERPVRTRRRCERGVAAIEVVAVSGKVCEFRSREGFHIPISDEARVEGRVRLI